MADPVENVVPIKGPAEVGALGISIITNMPGDRQMTTQVHIASDASVAEVNALVDRVWGFVDRAKARYEIIGKEAELEQQKTVLARMEEDIPRAEGEHVKTVAQLRHAISVAVSEAKRLETEGYDHHIKTGRRGTFKPQGATASAIAACNRQVDAYNEQIEKAEAEKQKFLVNIKASGDRFREEIAKIEGEIARRKALLT